MYYNNDNDKALNVDVGNAGKQPTRPTELNTFKPKKTWQKTHNGLNRLMVTKSPGLQDKKGMLLRKMESRYMILTPNLVLNHGLVEIASAFFE